MIMMTIAQIMEKMIAFSEGNIHDITHLSCVWTYAKTIGELEGLDAETQFILEVAAITHDIACPLCRKKYGNTNGSYQEQEGAPLVREFLADTGMTTAQIDRVAIWWGITTARRRSTASTTRFRSKRIISSMHPKAGTAGRRFNLLWSIP